MVCLKNIIQKMRNYSTKKIEAKVMDAITEALNEWQGNYDQGIDRQAKILQALEKINKLVFRGCSLSTAEKILHQCKIDDYDVLGDRIVIESNMLKYYVFYDQRTGKVTGTDYGN